MPPVPAPTGAASGAADRDRGESGSSLHTAGLSVGAVGIAAVLVGAFYSYRAHSLESQVAGAMTFSPSDDSSGASAHTMQFVMYGIGAAAVVTSGVLYLLGSQSGEQQATSSTSLVPLVGPGGGGAVFHARF